MFEAQAATIYVRANGTGTGSSWANATPSLTHALSIANAGDQVWVARGSYRASASGNSDTSFHLKNGVAVYGGFTGTESTLAQRADTTGIATILNGDLGSGVRSKHIVYGNASLNSTAILDGFTISGGSLTTTNTQTDGGAGMYNYGSPQLLHLIFENNIVSLTVTSNNLSSIGGGGGLYNKAGSPSLKWVTFRNNEVRINVTGSPGQLGGGGGMLTDAGAPVLSHISFNGNKVIVSGYIGCGGGLYAVNNAVPELTNIRFSSNSVTSTNTSANGNRGGGMFTIGAVNSPSAIKMTNILFEKNTAYEGSGLYVCFNSATLTNATFYGNSDGSPFNDYDLVAYFCNLSVYNTLIEGMAKNSGSATFEISNSNISGGVSNGFTGTNNQFGLPIKFIDASKGNYALMHCSDAINTGDDSKNTLSSDLRGAPRKYGQIDRGAFEMQRPATAPDIIYVKQNNTQTIADGASWSTAFNDLQTALNYNCNGIYPAKIWMAEGRYLPSLTGEREERFELKNNMVIFGGFAGNEANLIERDSTGATHTTILSGELQGDNDSSNNSKTVVWARDIDSTSQLNGLTISGGFGGTGNTGAGVYLNNSNPMFTNVIIADNGGVVMGGGMATFNAGPILTRVKFINNNGNTGAGLCAENNMPFSAPRLKDVSFERNTAGFGGGGCYLREANATFTDVTFKDNRATHYGAGLMIDIGSPVLTHVSFTGNEVTDRTPMGNSGGAIYSNGAGSPVMNDILFANNKANYGAALYLYMNAGNTTVTNATFSGNEAFIQGNTIYYVRGSIAIRNSIFDTVNNFRGNFMVDGAANNLSITSSLFRGSFPGIYINGGNNLLHTDPVFADAANNDYRLKSCSPAINAGNNSFIYPGNTKDLANNPRLYVNGVVDLGAYEFQGAKTTPFAITAHPLNRTIVSGGTATFSVATTGAGVTYQWQVSTNGGSSWTNISPNGTGSTLSVPNVTMAMNGYRYRCVVDGCPAAANSSMATLTVTNSGSGIMATNSLIGSMTAYPNPGKGLINLTVTLAKPGAVTWIITDITGRNMLSSQAVLHQGPNQLLVDLGSYANGLYNIAAFFEYDNQQQAALIGTLKLVKQDQ